MSFTSAEYATATEPIELLAFARDNEAWYHTLSDQDITRNGVTYRAGLIEREPFKQSDESAQMSTTIRVGAETPLGALMLAEGLRPVEGVMYVRIMLTHLNDTETITPFVGEVTQLKRYATHVEFTVEGLQSLFKRKLLRVVGGTQCNHALYDSSCGVNPEDFKILATVVAINGRIVAAGSSSDPLNTLQTTNYYAGGVLVFGRERYFIESNDNIGNLTIMEIPINGAMIGQPDGVTLYAGCDRTYSTCQSRFNNTRNFGGFPKFPVTNPLENAR